MQTPLAARTTKSTYDDVNLLLRLYDMRREDRLRQARAWFASKFRATSMEDFQKLCPPGSDENASFRQVTSYWEMVASFINQGVLNEQLFFENTREMLLVQHALVDERGDHFPIRRHLAEAGV